MQNLTAEKVRELLVGCLFHPGEAGMENSIVTTTIRGAIMGFHPGRVEEKAPEIKELLDCLPDQFQEVGGGGWSFLNACMTKTEEQWGEHTNIDELLALGRASGWASLLIEERENWRLFPGGMPFFVIRKERLKIVTQNLPVEVIKNSNIKARTHERFKASTGKTIEEVPSVTFRRWMTVRSPNGGKLLTVAGYADNVDWTTLLLSESYVQELWRASIPETLANPANTKLDVPCGCGEVLTIPAADALEVGNSIYGQILCAKCHAPMNEPVLALRQKIVNEAHLRHMAEIEDQSTVTAGNMEPETQSGAEKPKEGQ